MCISTTTATPITAGSVAFTGGERRGELVRLTYDDTFMGDGYKQVTLRERGEGWQFVSNLAVQTEEKVPLESGLAALPAELADKVVVTGPGDVTEGGSGVLATYYYAPDYNTEWGGLLSRWGATARWALSSPIIAGS